jgi:hypothetical protein
LAASSSGCAGAKPPSDPSKPPSRCAGIGSSNLEGACIWFPEATGSWTLAQAAAGIEVPYAVIIEAEIPKVIPRAQDAGHCTQPGPSELDVFEQLEGNGQSYCECDSGLCAGPSEDPRTIPAGQTAQMFRWTGTNWSGASDTNNPLGPPFAAGVYTLKVSAVGTVDGEPFEVSNHFELTLTP